MAAETLTQVWHPEIKTTWAFRASFKARQKIFVLPQCTAQAGSEGVVPKVPKIFPVVREVSLTLGGLYRAPGGVPPCSCLTSTGACADPRTGLSPKLSSTSKWQTPVYFPKGSKEFPHFSSWEIALLSVSFLSASSFALSAFLTPISSSLYHLCCCPSFQNIPWNSDCSAVFCSRLVETQIL